MPTLPGSALMRIAHRIGRRGCYLLFLALLDLVIAYSMTPFAVVAQLPLYHYISQYLPIQAWAGIWAGVGVICGIQAFARRDHFGFAVATLLKFTWSALSIAAWTSTDIPRGWLGGVVWLAFGAMTAIIASWPEARPLILAAAAAENAIAPAEPDGDG